MAKANNQTGLASGTSPPQACQEVALGVNRPICPTLLQVALWGPCGAFPTINERCVAMMLMEGSLLEGARRISHSPKKEVLDLVVTPQ
jgi:hypothetical protein